MVSASEVIETAADRDDDLYHLNINIMEEVEPPPLRLASYQCPNRH